MNGLILFPEAFLSMSTVMAYVAKCREIGLNITSTSSMMLHMMYFKMASI